MVVELPFILQEGEKLIKNASSAQYYGVGIINIGFVGGKMGGSGWFGGITTNQQKKREKSVFDAQNCHVYLTNKRIVFVKAKISLISGKETKLENIFCDIPLEFIEGIYTGTKFKINPTIELSVRSLNGEINKLVFAFLKIGSEGVFQGMKNPVKGMFDAFKPARIEERDEWINLIKKYKSSSKNKNSSEIEEPLKILKFRFAKGEISKKEYNQMKKELNS